MNLIKKTKQVGKNLLQLSYILSKINWLEAIRLYDKDASVVILLSFLKGRFGIELFCWDLGYLQSCLQSKTKFCFSSSLEKHHQKKIFWSPSKRLLNAPSLNYAKQLVELAQQAEKNGNQLSPSSFEVSFLENKSFMYRYFQENGIRTPATRIFPLNNGKALSENDLLELKFPLLVKGEHAAGGEAVYKVNSKEELAKLITSKDFVSHNENVILQELLNIRRDLRVTYIGKEIVHHYWRINQSMEWKLTSTCHGSSVDFVTFPEKWRPFIEDVIKKCKLRMGAFDIAWQNDDLSTEPYILEVSPRFSPNPPVSLEAHDSYGLWKKRVFGKNPYHRLQSDLIFQMADKYLRVAGQ